mmetsp:Transcript_10167/g.20680  ORF Transcript_10167/g.20680 Transcript_10167/m.20680 type:complete len:204 (-) Transcript_10167:150-761(-)
MALKRSGRVSFGAALAVLVALVALALFSRVDAQNSVGSLAELRDRVSSKLETLPVQDEAVFLMKAHDFLIMKKDLRQDEDESDELGDSEPSDGGLSDDTALVSAVRTLASLDTRQLSDLYNRIIDNDDNAIGESDNELGSDDELSAVINYEEFECQGYNAGLGFDLINRPFEQLMDNGDFEVINLIFRLCELYDKISGMPGEG